MQRSVLATMTDDLREKLDAYREQLVKCSPSKSESVYQKVADSYEDDLLEAEDFPSGYFEFVLSVLSEGQFYSKPGAWNFLLVLGTEKQKMQGRYQTLAEVLVENYEKYADEDLCLAVCDFIARNYSGVDAKAIFDRLAAIESRKPEELQGLVKDGLRILAAEEKRAELKS